MRIYPQSKIITADAYSVLLAWGLLALVMATVIVGGALKLPEHWLNTALALFFFGFIALAFLHVALAFSHACPSCGKHPTVQGFKPIHPNAVPSSGMSGWARVVWSIYRERQFICIHCGESWRVNV